MTERFSASADWTDEFLEWMDRLAAYGEDPAGGVTRLLYSASWKDAQLMLEELMRANGLLTYFDDAGNLYGRLEGTEPDSPTILTGSHIDTVKSGGRYDGAYGVLAGIMALSRLKNMYGTPRVSLETVAFCEEEGSRFPLAYWGSGNVTGMWHTGSVPEARDSQGISLREAMEAAGFGPGTHRSCRRDDLLAYIELHIEQGAVLEKEGFELGLVEGIVGQQRWKAEVVGVTNHAGTTPMSYRHDALSAASEMILAVERRAVNETPPLVATVGRIEASPNIVNVISGKVSFTLDVRCPDETQLNRFTETLFTELEAIAATRKVSLKLEPWLQVKPAPMNRALIDRLQNICAERSFSHRRLYSGAGHDAQVLAQLCPAAMLFVPSRKGISHSPDEYTEPRHLTAGVQVLTDLLYDLAYKGEAL